MSRRSAVSCCALAALLLAARGGASGDAVADADALQSSASRRCSVGAVQPVLEVSGLYEGIAAAPNGDVFVSDQATLDVLRITPGGEVDVVTTLYEPPDNTGDNVGTFGMTFTPNGGLWIAAYDFVDGTHHGIYRVTRDGVAELAIAMNVAEAPFPNGIVFDDRGNLYITESIMGTVWRVARGESVALPWLQHSLLEPTGRFGFGANGIAFKDRALYVVNTDQGSVVEVTIDAHGDPGTPSVFATDIFSPDGITVGPWRELYVSDAFTGSVVRIASDGTTEVAASSGFAEPANTSLVFGAGAEQNTVYLTNFGFAVPGVVKVNLCDR